MRIASSQYSSQTITAGRLLDAWGTGVETTLPRNIDPFGYNAKWGYYYDRETALYLCQNRMYDASAGRWINRDPIGYAGGVNLYAYCSGGPVGWADESGLSKGKIVYRFLKGSDEFIEYWIHPTRKRAKSAAKRGGGRVRYDRTDQSRGPGHFHNEADPRVHHTWEDAADANENPEWKNYRNKGTRRYALVPPLGLGNADCDPIDDSTSTENPWYQPLKDGIEFLDPTPIGLAMDAGRAFGDNVVGPFVSGAVRKRQAALDRWLDSE